jgi:hypothetical protein
MTGRMAAARRNCRRGPVAALVLAALVALGGCGSAGRSAADTTRNRLRADVGSLVDAVATGGPAAPGARAALARLQQDLAHGIASGTINAAQAHRVRAAIDALGTDLRAAAPSTSTSAPPQPAPTRADRRGRGRGGSGTDHRGPGPGGNRGDSGDDGGDGSGDGDGGGDR